MGYTNRLLQDGLHFFSLQAALIRGSTIKYIRLPDDVISTAQEYNKRQQAIRRANRDAHSSPQKRPGQGAGRSIHAGGSSDRPPHRSGRWNPPKGGAPPSASDGGTRKH